MSFAERVFSVLDVDIQVSDEDLARIPAEGPLVTVANHPTGLLEGLLLPAIVSRVRPDVRLLANSAIRIFPELNHLFIGVDPFGTADARRRNLGPLRESISWLRNGGALAAFPAGEVAHFSLAHRAVVDPPWIDTAARLVMRTRATVVPVWFDGENSRLFHILGLVHPRLRTALLIREFLARRGGTIRMRIGCPLPFSRLMRFKDPCELTEYLRLKTFLLARPGRASRPVPVATAPISSPIAAPTPASAIQREIDALPQERFLVSAGDMTVFYAKRAEIPAVVREIGRLREITFRAVHEGTGQPLDLSRYDDTYFHLVLWDRNAEQIAGAYRMGATDEILPKQGKSGLYCTSLFRISRRLLDRIGPALEVGRSFVVPEHQRSYGPLMLLWKGISRFAVRYPRYRMLFGPVSINNDYQTLSKQFIVAFLKSNEHWSDLAELVRARKPPRLYRNIKNWDPRSFSRVVSDISEVSDLVSEVEHDRKGVPILLRQYLKLGARLLGFNVDPDFGDVLDGLILVDLARTEPRILKKYMGADGMASFLRYHRERERELVAV